MKFMSFWFFAEQNGIFLCLINIYSKDKNMNVTYEDVRNSEEIRTYIKQADESLKAIGYTEHSFAHCIEGCESSRGFIGEVRI